MTNEFEEKILELYKTNAYQKINAYYGHNTVFNVLGIERSENRHSAFLAWLLNPGSSHGLKELPLRKFITLVAVKSTGKQCCGEIRNHLVSGDYSMSIEVLKTEQSIIGLSENPDLKNSVKFKNDSKNRFDVWIKLIISYTDDSDNAQQWVLPIVVENKIYSSEGNKKDEENAQTVRYRKAIDLLKEAGTFGEKETCQPFLVFLTPPDADGPIDETFIHLTYQQLLDNVILPCSIILDGTYSDEKLLIDGYIRNLSCPSNRDGEKIKDYSILAIAETESDDLNAIFESEAFKLAFCARYSKEAYKLEVNKNDISDNRNKQSNDAGDESNNNHLLEQFWDTNEDLFKIVLYNRFKADKEKKKIVNGIIKVSNRDNTRYFIGIEEGERVKWLNKDGRPVPKSEASFLIFKAFCEKNKEKSLTLNKLREYFPTTLNTYYYNRFLNHLFYDLSNKSVKIDYELNPYFNRENGELTPADHWDFYWDDDHKLPNVEGNVHNVKMWRKHDFDRLVEKAGEFGIVVQPAE